MSTILLFYIYNVLGLLICFLILASENKWAVDLKIIQFCEVFFCTQLFHAASMVRADCFKIK